MSDTTEYIPRVPLIGFVVLTPTLSRNHDYEVFAHHGGETMHRVGSFPTESEANTAADAWRKKYQISMIDERLYGIQVSFDSRVVSPDINNENAGELQDFLNNIVDPNKRTALEQLKMFLDNGAIGQTDVVEFLGLYNSPPP